MIQGPCDCRSHWATIRRKTETVATVKGGSVNGDSIVHFCRNRDAVAMYAVRGETLVLSLVSRFPTAEKSSRKHRTCHVRQWERWGGHGLMGILGNYWRLLDLGDLNNLRWASVDRRLNGRAPAISRQLRTSDASVHLRVLSSSRAYVNSRDHRSSTGRAHPTALHLGFWKARNEGSPHRGGGSPRRKREIIQKKSGY